MESIKVLQNQLSVCGCKGMKLITGHLGFIGSELTKKLDLTPVSVDDLPRGDIDFFFHFGSPSSQILFSEDKRCISETITDFLKVAEYCKRKHIKLIFPSTSCVYDNVNAYAHTKSALEEIAQAYDLDYLALRIFAGYGPGEGHKKHYASVIYQWIRELKMGLTPMIYGDGKQERDFVYIDDIITTIEDNMYSYGHLDIGTGVNTSFNDLFEIITTALKVDVKPAYVGKPKNYISSLKCNNPLEKFTTVRDGVDKIVDILYSN